jgi:hypothetical protein
LSKKPLPHVFCGGGFLLNGAQVPRPAGVRTQFALQVCELFFLWGFHPTLVFVRNFLDPDALFTVVFTNSTRAIEWYLPEKQRKDNCEQFYRIA